MKMGSKMRFMGKENTILVGQQEQAAKSLSKGDKIELTPQQLEELVKWADPKSADFWDRIESAIGLTSSFMPDFKSINGMTDDPETLRK